MLTEMHLSFFHEMRRGAEQEEEEENTNDQMVITASLHSPDHDICVFSSMYYYHLCVFQIVQKVTNSLLLNKIV